MVIHLSLLFTTALLLTRLTSLPILIIYILVQCVDIPKATLGLILVRKRNMGT